MDMENEEVLYKAHPSMFRSHPMWFILWVILTPAVIGLIVLLVWWYRCAGTTIEVTNVRTVNREGILSKSTTEVRHVDVKQLHTHQSFFQRLLHVGTIEISSAGTGGIEISISGLPKPERIVNIIHKAQDTGEIAE
jgi:uncharacterized membrane protein YdbT with pleckstrin-like domain